MGKSAICSLPASLEMISAPMSAVQRTRPRRAAPLPFLAYMLLQLNSDTGPTTQQTNLATVQPQQSFSVFNSTSSPQNPFLPHVPSLSLPSPILLPSTLPPPTSAVKKKGRLQHRIPRSALIPHGHKIRLHGDHQLLKLRMRLTLVVVEIHVGLGSEGGFVHEVPPLSAGLVAGGFADVRSGHWVDHFISRGAS